MILFAPPMGQKGSPHGAKGIHVTFGHIGCEFGQNIPHNFKRTPNKPILSLKSTLGPTRGKYPYIQCIRVNYDSKLAAKPIKMQFLQK